MEGANILLAHFHFCNKGAHPFSTECRDEELRALGNLHEKQIEFLRETRAYVQQNGTSRLFIGQYPHRQFPDLGSWSCTKSTDRDVEREWRQVRQRGEYEHSCYFVSQLYQETWAPGLCQVTA